MTGTDEQVREITFSEVRPGDRVSVVTTYGVKLEGEVDEGTDSRSLWLGRTDWRHIIPADRISSLRLLSPPAPKWQAGDVVRLTFDDSVWARTGWKNDNAPWVRIDSEAKAWHSDDFMTGYEYTLLVRGGQPVLPAVVPVDGSTGVGEGQRTREASKTDLMRACAYAHEHHLMLRCGHCGYESLNFQRGASENAP
jgi:hypothetical protein